MNIFNLLLSIVSPSFTVYMQTLSYAKLTHHKSIKLNMKNLLIILLCGVLVCINTYVNTTSTRSFISLFILIMLLLYFYKDNIFKMSIYLATSYGFVVLYEILLATIIMHVIDDITLLESSIVLKSIFSLLTMFLTYFTCCIKLLSNFLDKLVMKLNNFRYILFFVIMVILFLLMVDFKNFRNVSIDVYINNLVLLICFVSIVVFALYNYFRINEELEKTETLLSFLTKYEKIIEENRINKHEMLNNLLILKSIENKNSKDYNQLLDDIIQIYNKPHFNIKNLYKLPSGLKGMFYYKLFGLEEKGYIINMNISKRLPNLIKIIKKREYYILCKVVNILLDNAIEAVSKTSSKIINIDIYREGKFYIIAIENTFSNKKIDLSKLNNKYYSTKGKNRGLGLYIADSLLKESECIMLERFVDGNIFVSKIIIK